MATISVPEARTAFTEAAQTFANVAAAQLPTVRDEAAHRHMVDAVAHVIRAADRLLATLAGSPTEAVDDREELVIVARALRSAAFLVIKQLVPDQAWFWTEEWQAGEREADADEAAGRTRRHDTEEEFFGALDAMDAERAARADVRAR